MNQDDILSLPRLVASIKREKKLIAICTGVFFFLAIFYILIAPSKYTANTSILLDPAQAATVSEISSKAQGGFEDAAIMSQIELVKSRRVAEKAMEYLSVSADNFDKALVDEKTLKSLMSGLRAYREGESYVVTIAYTAEDPKIAADRANVFAQAYIYDQINSFSEDSQKTSQWLQDKIRDLKQQSITANLEVQKFRKKHDIVELGGRSMNEQQLGNINEKLGNARAEVATTRVKYQYSKEIIENKNISAAVAAAFDNDVINNIRTQYLEDQKKVMELRRTLGNNHKTVKSLSKKLAESRNLIFSEMKRISESYKGDYEVALAKKESLESNLKELAGEKLSNDSQSFELEALEKEAEAYSNLYDEYLEKFELMQQQKSFPVAESRIITKAFPPLSKSHPKTMIIVGLSLILGVGLGVLLALLKDNFDSSFKRAGQIENNMGLHFLGFFPIFRGHKIGVPKSSDFFDDAYSQSVDAPLSVQAETCRNVKMCTQRKSHNKSIVIGVTADNPTSGKSIAAANLALYVAQSGAKCLLIDADLRRPVLSEKNMVSVDKGLNSVLADMSVLDRAIIQDPKTGLFILPSEPRNQSQEKSLASSKVMQQLVEACKENFDYIIIDLPPLSATVDASFSSVFVDYFLLALEWAKSKPNSLNFNLKLNEISKDKILGVILTEADMQELNRNYGHTVHPEYLKAS